MSKSTIIVDNGSTVASALSESSSILGDDDGYVRREEEISPSIENVHRGEMFTGRSKCHDTDPDKLHAIPRNHFHSCIGGSFKEHLRFLSGLQNGSAEDKLLTVIFNHITFLKSEAYSKSLVYGVVARSYPSSKKLEQFIDSKTLTSFS